MIKSNPDSSDSFISNSAQNKSIIEDQKSQNQKKENEEVQKKRKYQNDDSFHSYQLLHV